MPNVDLIDAALRPRAAVLDLGCGTGRLAIPLTRRGHPVLGVDESAEMLDRIGPGIPGLGALLDAEVHYDADGRSWTQRFTTRRLTEPDLHALLAGARLAHDRWLDQGRHWFAALAVFTPEDDPGRAPSPGREESRG